MYIPINTTLYDLGDACRPRVLPPRLGNLRRHRSRRRWQGDLDSPFSAGHRTYVEGDRLRRLEVKAAGTLLYVYKYIPAYIILSLGAPLVESRPRLARLQLVTGRTWEGTAFGGWKSKPQVHEFIYIYIHYIITRRKFRQISLYTRTLQLVTGRTWKGTAFGGWKSKPQVQDYIYIYIRMLYSMTKSTVSSMEISTRPFQLVIGLTQVKRATVRNMYIYINIYLHICAL